MVKGDRGLRSLEEEEVVARRGKGTDGRTDVKLMDMSGGGDLAWTQRNKTEMAIPLGTFPEGLRVLVVDDEPLCLMILDRMLRQCKYNGKCFCLS